MRIATLSTTSAEPTPASYSRNDTPEPTSGVTETAQIVRLHIGSVVLSSEAGAGFAAWPAGSRTRMANALNAELTKRLSADPGIARRLAAAGSSAVPALRAPELPREDDPETFGRRLAVVLATALISTAKGER